MSNKNRRRAIALLVLLLLVLVLTTGVQDAPLQLELIRMEVR
jgi:type II secretory pathway component PulL